VASLFAFPPAAASDLPLARRALVRNAAERAGVKGEIAKLQAMRAELEPKLDVVDQTEREVDNLLNRDAQSLIDRMRNNLGAALSMFGSKARDLDERLVASKHQAEVARRAIEAIDRELANIEVKLAELDEREKFLIADVVRESAEGIFDDFSVAADHLRDGLVRLTAISRFLAPETAEYRPGARRIALPIPDFVGSDGLSETVILAPAREIERVEAIIRQYAETLAMDARAPFPTLPEIDTSPDGAIYSDLTAPERRAVDQAFAPPVNHHRLTVDAALFDEQVAATRANS
jgi:hypothetical protein